MLKFSYLTASALDTHQLIFQNGPCFTYVVRLTDKGNSLIKA